MRLGKDLKDWFLSNMRAMSVVTEVTQGHASFGLEYRDQWSRVLFRARFGNSIEFTDLGLTCCREALHGLLSTPESSRDRSFVERMAGLLDVSRTEGLTFWDRIASDDL